MLKHSDNFTNANHQKQVGDLCTILSINDNFFHNKLFTTTKQTSNAKSKILKIEKSIELITVKMQSYPV